MGTTLINFWLQSLGDWLYLPMQIFTFMGYQQFYLLFIAIIYWCFNPRLGARLAVGLMVSAVFNGILKLAFHSPRPYWIDRQIKPLGAESSFGMPSGHAQNSIVFWGLLANRLRKPGFTVLFSLVVALIGISRLYLGVHFLGDVLAGWAAGVVLLAALIRLEAPFLNWFSRKSPIQKTVFLWLISLGILAAAEAVRWSLRNFVVPAEWIALAVRISGTAPIAPFSTKEFIDGAGVFFGLSAGFVQIARRGWFDPDGTGWMKILRVLLGLAGAFFIWIGLAQLAPSEGGWTPGVLRYLRYALLGYWVAYLAPAVFSRLKLLAPIRPTTNHPTG